MRLTCEQTQRMALDAVAGRLGASERELYSEHARTCEKCAARLELFADVHGYYQSVALNERDKAEIKGALQKEIRSAAERQRRRSRARPIRFWPAWGFGLAAAAASILAVVVLPRDLEDDAARVVYRSGESGPHGSDSLGQIVAGDVLRTGREGMLKAELFEQHLVLGADTTMRVDALRPTGIQLTLLRGSVAVDTNSPGRKVDLAIAAKFGRVLVTGTRFWVNSSGPGAVATWRGEVIVELKGRPGKAIPVGARRRLDAGTGKLSTLGAVTDVQLLSRLDEYPWGGSVESSDVAPPETAGLSEDGPSKIESTPNDPSGLSEHRQRPKRRERRQAIQEIPRPLKQALDANRCNKANEIVASLSALAPPDSAEMLGLIAECHLAKKETRSALALYRRIEKSYPGTATAQYAVFEIGRLHEILGEREASRRAFRRYLQRYRQGTLRGEAAFHLCGLDLAGKRFDQAMGCWRSFRRNYPNSDRIAEALALEAQLAMDHEGDLRRAAGLFHQAYKRGSGALLRSSAYWWAYCARKGDPTNFPRAAEEFLRNFPKDERAAAVKQWLNDISKAD